MQTEDRAATTADGEQPEQLGVNTVRLVGRVSAEPEQRELPSGDQLVQLRVVVPRPTRPARAARGGRAAAGTAKADEVPAARTQVDTIDVACWTAVTRRTAARLQPGQVVEVHGSLRRRFFRAGSVTQSRYEVEASLVRRVGGVSSRRAG
jgi:single-strand DNA-binding protein